jgi:hypothetical protein
MPENDKKMTRTMRRAMRKQNNKHATETRKRKKNTHNLKSQSKITI